MSARIVDQNTEREVYYPTAFCFGFVLLQQKISQTEIVQCITLAYFAHSPALIR